MAVEVDKAVGIHETKILRFVVGRAARGDGLRHEIVHLLVALATEGNQDLHRFRRIADGLGGELAEFGRGRQHDEDRLADDDACGRIVAKLRIVRIAERLKKGLRPGQIGDREVEEYLFVHGDGCSITTSTNEAAAFGQAPSFS